MGKRRERRERKKKRIRTCISILMIILGICLILLELIPKKVKEKKEEKALSEFYAQENAIEHNESNTVIENNAENPKKEELSYIGVLKIPKIGLEKGFVNKDSQYNDVEYGIEILNESDMPDTDKGNTILSAHSGDSSVSYFENLYKLKNDDQIEINYNSKKYIYKVTNIFSFVYVTF